MVDVSFGLNKMEDDSDLEEGEARSSICQGFDSLDDLAYLDERIENALGHLQKTFQGGTLSAELLGPKYGGYGTFLSSYEDALSAPILQSTPQTSPIVQRHSSSVPRKNAVRNLGALQSESCKLKRHQDGQNKRESDSSIQTSGNVSTTKGNAIMKADDAPALKPIRLKIKMGSEILSQKVAVVNRVLGPDGSPNSLRGNSHDDSRRMPAHVPLDTLDKSPSSILREMTSVSVPAGLLMSPLSDILLHAMEKPRQETVVENEIGVKVQKELPVLFPNMSSDALGNGKTLSGRKKRVVGSIDASTCKESASVGEIKKQKQFTPGPRAGEKSTCGLGRAIFSNDSSTFKHKLQKDINENRERDKKVVLKKSNKMNVSGGRLKDPFLVSREEVKKESPAKSKESFCNNRLGARLVSGAPYEHAVNIGQNKTDIGFGSEVAPLSTSLELDNWVQCDTCETWRLLPYGMKPEQLPDKWSCSMQSWLPGMNHCGLSQEETTNAIISLGQNYGSVRQNLGNGVIKLVSDAGQVNQRHQPLTSGLLPDRTTKKFIGKDSSREGLGITRVEAASSRRSNLQIPVQISTAENYSAGQISKAHNVGISREDKYVIDQKAKRAGTACQVRFKRKRESDQHESENSKKTKDTVYTERDTYVKVVSSKKKIDYQSQPTHGGNSLATKSYDKTIAPAQRKILMDYEDNCNGNDSELLAEGENQVSLNKKDTKTEVSIAECKEMKTHQTDGMHRADGFRTHSDTSCRFVLCRRGPVSGIATLSTSKVLGSHKSGRAHVEEVKPFPMESISSSPLRSSCPKDLASAGDSICDQNSKFGDLSYTNRNTKFRENQLQDYPSETKADSLQSAVSQNNVLKDRAAIKKVSALTRGSMDSSFQIANDVLSEANKLRKLADCLKSSGFESEHKEAKFKASLKFLYGASLLEMCSGENVLNEKMSHVEAYRIAAKLSESCALEYEANQEMAAAALAYKCTEVACMRVIYGRGLDASRDWSSFITMLQTVPKGESPSSPASDIDNFNHQGVVDKSSFSKGGLPHIAGNQLNVAKSQQNFGQLLDFAENINLGMEASRKSQNAFKAATVTLKESQFRDTVSSIKRVVNFSFHDVEMLIRQVERAMDALSHSNFCGVKY